jgi:thiamine-monophosphate kinase
MHEFDLIREICQSQGSPPAGVLIGPGDDLAEVQVGERYLLLGVDQLVIGRHVDLDTPPELIGRKAVARCLSDVAAMAGRPIATLVAAALPQDCEDEWAMAIFEAARDTAEAFGAPIIGGDIAAGEGVLSVTVAAESPAAGAVRRVGARAGDLLCVTGELGDAQSRHHLHFTPRIAEAAAILDAAGNALHAMIDISDGLGRDAAHLLEGGALDIELDAAAIPRRNNCAIEQAVSDGEDYELLFACEEPPPELADCPLTVIGRFSNGSGKVMLGQSDVSGCGWEHGR